MMDTQFYDSQHRTLPARSAATRTAIWAPAIAAAIYPWFLEGFHWAVTIGDGKDASAALPPDHIALASVFLLCAFAVPLLSLFFAGQGDGAEQLSPDRIRARRLALLAITAPTAYVFLGVLTYMGGSKIPDAWVWTPAWLLFGLWASKARATVESAPRLPSARLRVAHGVCGSIAATYALFHIFNHLFGIVSPAAHAEVMSLGRMVYRARLVEPLLVAVMLFQIVSGLRLVWTWSEIAADRYRTYQIASGVFMAVFILGHMNSVFIFARTWLGIPTDWAFAAGLPTGLIHDPWNIRLLPHYALGVFFVLTHLCSGLRVVMLTHNVSKPVADKAWWAGAAVSALISATIMCGMTGFRIA